MKKPKTIFKIYEYEVQEFAEERIGRQLSDEELSIAKKCLESGLLFDIGIILITMNWSMLKQVGAPVGNPPFGFMPK